MAGSIRPGAKNKATGAKVSDVVGEELAKEVDVPMEERLLDIERTKAFTGTGFSRMSTEWSGDNREMMRHINSVIEGAILSKFEAAFLLMDEIYTIVRAPAANADGEPLTDQFGFTIWAKSATGAYLEDWSRLGYTQREHLIYKITTSLFSWSQQAAELWTESMFAKGIWIEEFALAFDHPIAGTIEDRTAVGNLHSAEARYFAVFTSALSRRADALVRSVELLGQRLKDTSTQ